MAIHSVFFSILDHSEREAVDKKQWQKSPQRLDSDFTVRGESWEATRYTPETTAVEGVQMDLVDQMIMGTILPNGGSLKT